LKKFVPVPFVTIRKTYLHHDYGGPQNQPLMGATISLAAVVKPKNGQNSGGRVSVAHWHTPIIHSVCGEIGNRYS
jgi:hypothetical protein